MQVIAIINLKGGVAKTITSINMAHILVTVYGKRVLLIDNDKQGQHI
ncbi:MAG: Soj protein [Firmicutes bacterium]|nr:Soj protein [Bacillota bacterium]